MRIHAIRGCNLASLAGEFAIELDQEPLVHAGLFAITGPTGAGKSTLLDALCVALFDRTPRLGDRSSVTIGRPDEADERKLSATDVRSLLRHGTGAGWAEVEFAGRDGGRYRARWSVRRARNRPGGRFQPQQMELHELPGGRALGGTKSETLAAIEDKIGFSFEQFRRSALLAQGEFAAFLQASARQRADLLERMTGTEIYGAVSEVAYRRAQDEIRELADLQRREDEQAILADDERDSLEGERNAAVAALAGARDRLAELDRVRAWHARRIELERLHREATDELAALETQWNEGADDRAELARAEAALAVADRLDAVDRARRADAEAAAAHQTAGAALAAANAAVEAGRAELAAAESAAGDGSAIAAVSADWSRWDSALDRLCEVDGELARLAEVRPGRLEAEETAREALAARRREVADAKADLERTRGKAARAEKLAAERPVAELRATRARLEGEREALRDAAAAAEAAAQAAREQAEATSEAAAARADDRRLGARIAELDDARPNAAARADEAQRAYEQLRLAADLAVHRSSLVDGEPCPLCGAEEHPWADRASPVDRAVDDQRARVDELRAAVAAIERERAGCEVERKARRADARKADRRARAADARRREASEAWGAGVRAMGELPLIADAASADAAEWVAARLSAIDERLDAMRDREADAGALAARAQAARSAVEARRSHLDHAQEAERAAERALQQAVAALREVDDARERAVAVRARLAGELREGLAGTDGAAALLDDDPARLRRELGAAVAAPRASIDRARADLARASERLASATAVEAAARASHDAAARERARAEAELSERDVDEAELRAALARGRDWIAEAARARDALRTEIERLRTVVGERAEQRARHAAGEAPEQTADQAAEARAAAEAALEETQSRLAELTSRLRIDDLARARRAELGAAIAAQLDRAALYRSLSELIGSADGKKFRQFAQSLTLDVLLAHANDHLAELASRYRLARVPGFDLDLQVIDRDMGDEVRSINSLSGGESFLVSLALALGLSSLSARDVRVESLLIDEGFGSLDASTLEVALSVLDALQATGRKVGLISHVPGLAERIGVRVAVTPRGGGKSVVRVGAG